jgi:tetratricopeptide (TPR) repeat protein
MAAAETALRHSAAVKIQFMVARVLTETGALGAARTIATRLASNIQAEPQAYGKIIESDIALKQGNSREAIEGLIQAIALLDTWIGRFDLGRAYLEAGAFTQADSEFERCLRRRGEALALFLDEEPTYGYLPIIYYHQGRARESLNSTAFPDS